jgi:hypothetical protein
LNRIACIGNKKAAVVLWAADEVFYAPHIAVDGLALSAIATPA